MWKPPENLPPVAKAGPDITLTLPTNRVTVEGDASDPDNNIKSIKWTQKSGPSDADLQGTSTSTLTASNLVEGKYVFEFMVTDEHGEKDRDRVIVIVGVPENLPPNAHAGPNITISMPTNSASIEGKGTDKDDGIDSYKWSQVSGPTEAQMTDPEKPTVEISNLQVGRYVFELQVTDKTGDSDDDRVVVTVLEAEPTISGGHYARYL